MLPAHLLPTKPANVKVILGPAPTWDGGTEHQEYEIEGGPHSWNLQLRDQLAPGQLTPAETEGRNVVKDMSPHEVLVPNTLRWRKQAQKNTIRGWGGDTTRSSCQFWLCLNWGKASNKKTRCGGLQAVKDQLWRELELPGFVPLPSREVVGTLKVAFSLGEKTKPATGAHLTLQEGPGKGERSMWCWGSAKRLCMMGDKERSVGAAIPQVWEDTQAKQSMSVAFWQAEDVLQNIHNFLLLLFLSFICHGNREGFGQVQLSGRSPSLVGTQPLTAQEMIYIPWWGGAAACIPVAASTAGCQAHTPSATIPILHLSTEVFRGSGYPHVLKCHKLIPSLTVPGRYSLSSVCQQGHHLVKQHEIWLWRWEGNCRETCQNTMSDKQHLTASPNRKMGIPGKV